jgi:hypothetical protein
MSPGRHYVARAVPVAAPQPGETVAAAVMVGQPPTAETRSGGATEEEQLRWAMRESAPPKPSGPTMGIPVVEPVAVRTEPVAAEPAVAQRPVVLLHMGPRGYAAVPPGAEPGGTWGHEPYCGPITTLSTCVACLSALARKSNRTRAHSDPLTHTRPDVRAVFWPVACCIPFCCQCDDFLVYTAPDGRRYTPDGCVAPYYPHPFGHPASPPRRRSVPARTAE